MQPPIMHFDPAEIAHVPTTGVRRVHVRVSVDFAKEFGCYPRGAHVTPRSVAGGRKIALA